MKKRCYLALIGLCMTVVSFGQEKPSKNPPPPPPPPEIVKDVKIENVQNVQPPPPPPAPPHPPKKPKPVVHKNINNVEISREEKIERITDSLHPDFVIDKITGTVTEIDTTQPPPPPKKLKHPVHHKVKTVVVQPKDPGKTTKPKKPATSI